MAGGGEKERREGSRDGGGSSPIYRLEGFEGKLMVPGKGWSGPGCARRRGGDQRGGTAHGGAAWRFASRSGACGKWGRSQLACQAASLRSTGGPNGRGRRPPYASGGWYAAAEDRGGEMEVGACLQFLKIQGLLGKLKFSLLSGAQIKKC